MEQNIHTTFIILECASNAHAFQTVFIHNLEIEIQRKFFFLCQKLHRTKWDTIIFMLVAL